MIARSLFLSVLLFCAVVYSNETEPLWEYGVGVGYVRYEQYPASDQSSELLLPFPTFQYRGRVVRADDREGTRAYLFKDPHWTLELAGGLNPALNSGDNRARKGMEDLPWIVQLGPQVIYRWNENWEARLGAFQAVASDFSNTKLNGATLEGQVRWTWELSPDTVGFLGIQKSFGFVSYSLNAGNEDFLATYFSVSAKYANPDRQVYEARSGLLSEELGYFQSFILGRASVYIGGTGTDYSISANRQSPLHKADRTLTFFVGLNYVLGESSRESVSEKETRGLINRHPRPH